MESRIIKEIQKAVEGIDEKVLDLLIDEIKKSSRVFLWGLGRSGMMAKAFAMRLRHLGLESYFIGELCPAFRKKDLLIVVSKTAKSRMLFVPVEVAKKSKTRTICITASKNRLEKICNRTFILKLPESIQFGGSLFEQTVFIFFDELVDRYRRNNRISFQKMERNHVTWE